MAAIKFKTLVEIIFVKWNVSQSSSWTYSQKFCSLILFKQGVLLGRIQSYQELILKMHSIYGTGNEVQLASQKATSKRNCHLDPQALSSALPFLSASCFCMHRALSSHCLLASVISKVWSLKRRHQNIDCQPSIHTRFSLGEMPTTRPMSSVVWT